MHKESKLICIDGRVYEYRVVKKTLRIELPWRPFIHRLPTNGYINNGFTIKITHAEYLGEGRWNLHTREKIG